MYGRGATGDARTTGVSLYQEYPRVGKPNTGALRKRAELMRSFHRFWQESRLRDAVVGGGGELPLHRRLTVREGGRPSRWQWNMINNLMYVRLNSV
jgi:hypothetical protein